MTTDTLTERYIEEVIRRLPNEQRDDVAEELRTTIADTIEARDETDTAEAEHDVLTELGDPVRLAASYADRPLTLIGPTLFPSYIRMLKLLLLGVLPVVVTVLVFVDIIESTDPGSAIGTGIQTILTVGGQMVAWLTVIYAVVDRVITAEEKKTLTKSWTPQLLPERTSTKRDTTNGSLPSLIWYAFMLGLILWQRTGHENYVEGERVQVLDPNLWSGWIWPVVIGLSAMLVLELVRIAAGRWEKPLAVTQSAAEATFGLVLAGILFQEQFFNPEFLSMFNEDWTVTDEFYLVAGIGLLVATTWSIVTRLREAFREP